MRYFTEQRETKKITLPSNKDLWVEVLADLRYGEIKQFATVNQLVAADKLLQTLIKDWNLDDENGEKAPVDEAHINLLKQEDVTEIVKSVGEIVAPQDTPEKKSS